jgi:stalled ribosome rescue protein Dom34
MDKFQGKNVRTNPVQKRKKKRKEVRLQIIFLSHNFDLILNYLLVKK